MCSQSGRLGYSPLRELLHPVWFAGYKPDGDDPRDQDCEQRASQNR